MDNHFYVESTEYRIYPRRYLRGYYIGIYEHIRRPILSYIADVNILKEMFDMRDQDSILNILKKYNALMDEEYLFFINMEDADRFIEYLFSLITVFKFQNKRFYISTNDRIILYRGV